jgi:hypothetical protein
MRVHLAVRERIGTAIAVREKIMIHGAARTHGARIHVIAEVAPKFAAARPGDGLLRVGAALGLHGWIPRDVVEGIVDWAVVLFALLASVAIGADGRASVAVMEVAIVTLLARVQHAVAAE